MKIFLLRANENWICDRFVNEWVEDFPELSVDNPADADILWLLSSWCWNQLPYDLMQKKTVVTTVHHIDIDKFDDNAKRNFAIRDAVTDFYHVPCQLTAEQIRPYTSKEIFVQPFWVNQNIWKDIPDNKPLREKLGLPVNGKLIGSFQRDTEGHDLKSPKLSKGPDIFCDLVEEMHKSDPSTEVVLAGWRRQYVISRLEKAGINYHYFEWADFELLNELYNCLDLYLVSSRCEGGPQSIAECAITNTPIVSTDVGLARRFLAEESIFSQGRASVTPNTTHAFSKIIKHQMPDGFQPFLEYFKKIGGK